MSTTTVSLLREQADALAGMFTPDDKDDLAQRVRVVQNLAHRVSEAPVVGPDHPEERKAWALFCLCNGPEHWDCVEPEARDRFRRHVGRYSADPSLIEARHPEAQRATPSPDIRRALGLPAAA